MTGMLPLALVTLAALHVFDAACAGFRDAAGRDGRIDKRTYYARAVRRGAAVGVVIVVVMGCAMTRLLQRSDDPLLLGRELCYAAIAAGDYVYVPYATVIGGALLLRGVASVDGRSLLSVLIFGPLLLLRPVVALAGVVWAYARIPRWEVAALGLTATLLALSVEPFLGLLRRLRRRA